MGAALAIGFSETGGRRAPAIRPTHLALVRPARSPWEPDIHAKQRPGTVHITRSGRLALTLVTAAFAAATLATATVAGGGPVAGTQSPRVTVIQGQTLSEIAAAALPDLPMREGVARIRLANNLATDYIRAGSTLVIPHP